MGWKIGAVVACMTAGMGFLVVSSSGKQAHPHLKLAEFSKIIDKEPSRFDGTFMTIYGNVKEGTITRQGVKARFVLAKDGRELNVQFTGKTLLPDTFKDGSQAAIDGYYLTGKNEFRADKIMAKCASKYDSAGGYQKKAY